MMKRTLLIFVVGLIVGVLATGVLMMNRAPGMMMLTDESTLGFDETVQAIIAGAEEAGWKVPAVHPISESVAKAGIEVRRVTVVELCKASLAGRVLADESGRRVAPMMPCRVAICETADGKVTLSRMNSGLMSRMFGGIVQEVMTEAADENEEIFAGVLD